MTAPNAGTTCPGCLSLNTETVGYLEVDGDEALQREKCFDCGSTWENNYTLVNYSNFAGPGRA